MWTFQLSFVSTLYHMSQKCVENKKKDRVLVSDILPELDILVETKLSWNVHNAFVYISLYVQIYMYVLLVSNTSVCA